jgi:hypothetical protein
VVLKAAVLLALVAGCSPGTAPTRTEYLSSLDAICRKADAEAASLGTSPDPADHEAVGDYLTRRRGISRRQLVALQKLRRPAGDDPEIDLIVRELGAQLGLLDAASVVADGGDQASLRDLLLRIQAGEAGIDRAFEDYGAAGCAVP